MRMVFTMASLLIVSLLIFNGYSNDAGNNMDAHAGERPMTPIVQAKGVNRLIQDTAIAQQQAIENQTQSLK